MLASRCARAARLLQRPVRAAALLLVDVGARGSGLLPRCWHQAELDVGARLGDLLRSSPAARLVVARRGACCEPPAIRVHPPALPACTPLRRAMAGSASLLAGSDPAGPAHAATRLSLLAADKGSVLQVRSRRGGGSRPRSWAGARPHWPAGRLNQPRALQATDNARVTTPAATPCSSRLAAPQAVAARVRPLGPELVWHLKSMGRDEVDGYPEALASPNLAGICEPARGWRGGWLVGWRGPTARP